MKPLSHPAIRRLCYALLTLSLLCAVCVLSVSAESGTCGKNLTWELTDGTLTISGKDEMENYSSSPWEALTVTSVVIGDDVTSIGQYAFQDCQNIVSVSISSSSQIKSIGEAAFLGCTSLNFISLPPTLITIGMGAFLGCTSLTEITIPASVTSIASWAFDTCSSLSNVTFEGNNVALGTEVFGGPSNASTLCAENLVFHIECGFPETSLQKLAIYGKTIDQKPHTDTANSDGFCDACREYLTDLPHGFCGFNSETSNVKDLVWVYDSDTTTLRIFGSGMMGETSPWADLYQNSITKVVIGSDVKDIAKSAFYGHSALQTVEFEGNPTVTAIYIDAFYLCYSLTEITIPATVNYIGTRAFYGCYSLNNITFLGNTMTDKFGDENYEVFTGCPDTLIIHVPCNVSASFAEILSHYNRTVELTHTDSDKNGQCDHCANPLGTCGANLSWLYNATTKNLTVTGTGTMTDYATGTAPWYSYRTGITSVTFSNSLETIGSYAFNGCIHLSSVTVPASVTVLGEGAFMGCSALNSVTLMSNALSVQSFGANVFTGCNTPVFNVPCGTLSYEALLSSYGTIHQNAHYNTDDDHLCDSCNAPLPYADLATVSTKGELVLNFKITDNGADASEYTVFANNEPAQQLNMLDSSTINNKKYYTYSCSVPAKEIGKTITLTVQYQGTTVSSFDYSIEEYYRYILDYSSNPYMQDVAYTALNYGAAAQIFFNYDTANLVNAGISAPAGYDGTAPATKAELAEKLTYTPARTVEYSMDGLNFTGDGLGCSLLLEGEVSVRLYFSYTGNIGDIKISYKGEEVTPVLTATANRYYVQTTGISAKDLANTVTFTFHKDTTYVYVNYSPIVYIYNQYESTIANLPELCKAMYSYYKAAAAYAISQQQYNP